MQCPARARAVNGLLSCLGLLQGSVNSTSVCMPAIEAVAKPHDASLVGWTTDTAASGYDLAPNYLQMHMLKAPALRLLKAPALRLQACSAKACNSTQCVPCTCAVKCTSQ